MGFQGNLGFPASGIIRSANRADDPLAGIAEV